MVAWCLTPRSAHNVAKNFLTSCGPLSVGTNLEIPNETIQLSRNVCTMCVDDVLDVRMAFVCFEQWSVNTTINWLPCLVFGNGSRMFIATHSSWADAENNLRRFS